MGLQELNQILWSQENGVRTDLLPAPVQRLLTEIGYAEVYRLRVLIVAWRCLQEKDRERSYNPPYKGYADRIGLAASRTAGMSPLVHALCAYQQAVTLALVPRAAAERVQALEAAVRLLQQAPESEERTYVSALINAECYEAAAEMGLKLGVQSFLPVFDERAVEDYRTIIQWMEQVHCYRLARSRRWLARQLFSTSRHNLGQAISVLMPILTDQTSLPGDLDRAKRYLHEIAPHIV